MLTFFYNLMNNRKKLTISLAILIGGIVVISVLSALGIINPVALKMIFTGEVIEPDVNMMTIRNAYDVALLRAREWQKDAVLTRITSLTGETSQNGRSDDWDLMFVSKIAKGKGFHIIINNKLIATAEETPFAGLGGELPENIISSKEAIDLMHQIRGYENEQVFSVEMIYSPDGKLYWGVKTSKGVTAIKAAR